MDDENEIYNQPLASFTFGKESLDDSLKKEKPKIKISNNLLNKNSTTINSLNKKGTIKKQNINTENINNNNYFENNSAQNYNIITGELYELTFGRNNNINNLTTNPNNDKNNNLNSLKNNNINNIPQKKIYSILINPGGMNNSFIYAVIYSIYHMKLFNKYITNDLNHQIRNKKSNILLSNLYEILIQMDKNKYINISNFRDNLSNLFQTHRKFLPGQPDDPSDLLFVLINSIHSFSINYPLNEISDENCVEKCFSHKFIWLDLSRIDKCKCSGSTKRLFSNHNYMTDIPMNKIFNLMRIKNKNKENYTLYENNKKLFEYYTILISRMKTNCPVNGQRCPINKTFHKLHLSNSPSYLIFNLEQDFNEYNLNYAFSSLNILKNFVLIPNKFDIWDLFELNSKKNKNDFDFIGCILFKISKVYSCAFKNNKGLIVYYDCNDIQNENINNNNYNNIMEFVSYFDLVVFCIKNGLIPLMLFYQGSFLTKKEKNRNNNFNTFEECLDKEQIDMLEKYCINTDNLYNILQNTLRKKENLMITKKTKNINDINKKNNIQEFKNNIIINDYICPNCNFKNKINDKICIQCNNNNDYLSNKIIIKNIPKNLTKQKESQSLTNSQILKTKIKPLRLIYNKFQKSQDNLKINTDNKITSIINKRKKVCVSPDIKLRDTDKILEKYNFETYPKRKEKFLMNIPPPIFITRRNTKEQKYFLNKTEINDDNDNNNKKMNLDKINIIKMIHKSPKVQKGRIIYNNKNNFPKHKKVLSSNEKFNFLKISKSNDNNIYKNKNSKLYAISRTITTNKKIKNLRNIDTEINEQKKKNKKKNLNIKYEYDRMNNKLIKNNKNTPVYAMHYSYNDIYLEQKVKRKNTYKLKNNKN